MCVFFLSSHIMPMFFHLPFLISLMSCTWAPGPRPPLWNCVFIYFSLLVSPPQWIWILLFMEFKFWDCFFVRVSLDICLLNHCPDSVSYVHMLQCESGKFWSCFFIMSLSVLNFLLNSDLWSTQKLTLVTLRDTTEVFLRNYWLFISLWGQGWRSWLIPMKSFR